jgi:hypothetical protein
MLGMKYPEALPNMAKIGYFSNEIVQRDKKPYRAGLPRRSAPRNRTMLIWLLTAPLSDMFEWHIFSLYYSQYWRGWPIPQGELTTADFSAPMKQHYGNRIITMLN